MQLMPKRTLTNYALITLKGMAMGAADVVPGVSGGTIAFISGIYEELIETIHGLNWGFFKVLRKDGVLEAWRSYNLGFLTSLFLGVVISLLSLAKLVTWLLETHPVLVWSFFFGLVLASIFYVGKQIVRWKASVILVLVLGAIFAYYITLARPIGSPENNWFLFLAGFIAIIAMILPGISGAFILLLLGAYSGVIGTLSGLSDGVATANWDLAGDSLLKLGIFATGAILGLKLFSRVLNWMFSHYKDLTLALLTGFMIGALNKIWPWKEVLSYRINHKGLKVPFIEKSIFPGQYEGDPQLTWALLLLTFGFLLIFGLERIAKTRQHADV